MKVLVTGGSGFIGTATIKKLTDDGHEVLVLDHQTENNKARNYGPGTDVFLGDIRDADAMVEAMAHVDAFIHLAGVLGTAETIKNPRPAAHTNIVGGLNVLEAAVQYNIPGINIAVGNWFENNTYSLTKNTVERFCKMYQKERGLNVTVVRGLNVFGPGQSVAAPFGTSKVRKVGPSFMCRALTGMPVEIYGDGENIMDFIYIDDMAKVLVKALDHTVQNGYVPTVVEAGLGRHSSVNDFAQRIRTQVENDYQTPVIINHLPMRPGETNGAVVKADASTLNLIGMDVSELVDIDTGIKNSLAYFHQYLTERGLR
jgi:UDP-glucose 4-epimerase